MISRKPTTSKPRISPAILAVTMLVPLFGSPASAGTIQPELAARMQGTPSQLIPVWIKVRAAKLPAERTAQLSKSAEAEHLTREAQYDRARTEIEQEAVIAQQGVRALLDSLAASGAVASITPRWIVNVIEARVTPAVIDELAARSDVDLVLLPPVVELITPIVGDSLQQSSPSLSQSPGTVGIGADYVRVRQAWGMGYTGKGRLVCSFDSGVQGTHDYLKNSWRGKGGSSRDSAAAWFDQVNKTRSPTYFGTGIPRMHGTHTMGIMVGRNGADTIGLAPDAQWISAAVIDIPGGASILSAFEWAADPDGDRNTLADVPDVINHSWGIQETGCDYIFDDAIDNLEALGIVNVFAAGNEGSVLGAVRNPANRARDSIDCFAVGNLDVNQNPAVISTSSSRGPSICNSAIKPNVSAPGTNVRSSVPDNSTGVLNGTSMAAPHVSALVALLRQKNPNATVREIKLAILNSTKRTGYTTGGTIPNNAVGWGVIDCEAALNLLPAPPPAPLFRLYAFPSTPVTVGGTVSGRVILKNIGGAASGSFTAQLTSANPAVSIVDGSAAFGPIPAGDTLRASDDLSFSVAADAQAGSVIPLSLHLTGSGINATLSLSVQIEPQGKHQIAEIGSGRARFTFTNFGVYGLGPAGMIPLDSIGYRFGSGSNELYEAGLMLSRSITQVSSGVHSSLYEWLDDFTPAPDGLITFVTPARFGGKEARCRFTDTNATTPLGVLITQEVIAPPAPNDDIIFLRFIIDNPTATDLTGIAFSYFSDWDANAQYNKNAGGYAADDTVLWTAYNSGSVLSNYRGVQMIGDSPTSALTASASSLVYPAFSGVGADGFSPLEKYGAAHAGFSSSATFATGSVDLCQVLSTTLHLTPLTGRDTVLLALLAGNSSSEISAAAQRARNLTFNCCSGTGGDVNCDGHFAEIDDVTMLVDNLFISFAPLCCPVSADLDHSGTIDIGDLILLVDHMFITFTPLTACP